MSPLGEQDRTSFYCGVQDLDRYLLTQASQDAKEKVPARFVMVDPSKQILGYYTLSAYTIHLSERPPGMAKRLPKYPLLPATLLGRLGVSQSHRGRKLGTLLLMNALYRAWKNSAEIASIGVVAEAMNDAAINFYLHHEFIALSEHPSKLFINMKTLASTFMLPA